MNADSYREVNVRIYNDGSLYAFIHDPWARIAVGAEESDTLREVRDAINERLPD
jgi:hypothetical protein